MQLKRFTEPKIFKDLVWPFLLARESENCLIIGIVNTLIDDPTRFPEFYLAAFLDAKNEVHGVVWMTPPFPLGLTSFPENCIQQVAEWLSDLNLSVPAVVGPTNLVDLFAQIWIKKTGCWVGHKMSQRIYELSKVIPPRPTSGAMRLAVKSDLAVTGKWFYQFWIDSGKPIEQEAATKDASRFIEHKSLYLWQLDGATASMAAVTGPTPSGIRVGYVYTPNELRGKGYASALVSALSQSQLDGGKRMCFLYTDLANPTSNGIYQKIGYRPVCDSSWATFKSEP